MHAEHDLGAIVSARSVTLLPHPPNHVSYLGTDLAGAGSRASRQLPTASPFSATTAFSQAARALTASTGHVESSADALLRPSRSCRPMIIVTLSVAPTLCVSSGLVPVEWPPPSHEGLL